MTQALIGVVMGSSSDWDTMQHAVQILQQFGIPHDARVVSAHRMPDDMFTYAETAAARGLQAIIAGAGGAAHLPGMLAAKTVVPVLGVPVQTKALSGVDSLHSIVQMPKGVPVATFAIGAAGAANAALFAVAMLANKDPALRQKLEAFRTEQTAACPRDDSAARGFCMSRAILPGSMVNGQMATLGVMGGGQLGRMFVQAAQAMGYFTAVLDPDPPARLAW
jgi:5-(carboxyamino)imidazole ribonucleotide mutase